ncbi:GerMN domain-containing protein [Salibacterium sp. K-3]
MNRLLLLFITTALTLGVLAACGQGGENGQSGTEGTSDDTAQSEEETQEDDSGGSTSEETTEENENEGDTNTEVEQEETVETSDSEETVTETVTLYFSDDQLLEKYTEEQEVEASTEGELPAAALQAWIDGPEHEDLVSHFPEDTDVEVQSVEGSDGTAEVSFSSAFLDLSAGSSAEMAITEQIALIMEQFGYDQTKILIEGEEEDSLFGHMDASEPFSAENADEYEPIE